MPVDGVAGVAHLAVVILDAAARLRAWGRRLVLLRNSRVIERLLTIAGVTDEVELVSKSSAWGALASA
jgi:hypothetical protein